MANAEITERSARSSLPIVEALIGVALVVAAFVAIAASDVTVVGTHVYWTVLVVVFAIAVLATDRLHGGHALTDGRRLVRLVLHWLAVFVAVQLIYLFIETGRIANVDAGLTSGVVLALGTFIAGVYGNWRFMVLGIALAAASAGVALVEEYLWVLFGIAVAALIALVFGPRVFGKVRHRSPSPN